MTRAIDSELPPAPDPDPARWGAWLLRMTRHEFETDHDPVVSYHAARVIRHEADPDCYPVSLILCHPERSRAACDMESARAALEYWAAKLPTVGLSVEVIPGETVTRTPFPSEW